MVCTKYKTKIYLLFYYQPAPLFEKIDDSVVNQLKSRFAGKQKTPEKELAVVDGLDLKQIKSVEQMEEAVSKQVRDNYEIIHIRVLLQQNINN